VKLTRDEAKERILTGPRKRILLVGDVALLLGPLWSLVETEALLYEMVQEGSLRTLTTEEKHRLDTRHGFLRCK